MSESTDIKLTGQIVTAFLSKNAVAASDIPNVINTVYGAISGLGKAPEPVQQDLKPAVPVRRSVTPEYIVCLEDGRKLKMLKRHLRSTYGLSPDEYRAKWGLPADYPMVAPNYAAARSDMAKSIGLGRSRTGQRAQPAQEVQDAPVRKGRRKAAA